MITPNCGNIVINNAGRRTKYIKRACHGFGSLILGFHLPPLLSIAYCLKLTYFLMPRKAIIARVNIIIERAAISGLLSPSP